MEVPFDIQDEAIEKIMAGMRQWTPAERSEYCDSGPDHPLFMTKTPTVEEGAANPQLAAIASMAYDDDETPEDMAREAKDKGNAAFQRGAAFFGHAIKHYNDALDHIAKSSKPAHSAEMRLLLSTVHGNLAAVFLARKKFITAIGACDKALKANPKNDKAAFRAAKASLALGRASEAAQFCELILTRDPEASATVALLKEARAALGVQRRNAEAAAHEREERAVMVRRMREACRDRGIRVGRPIFEDTRRSLRGPWVEALGGGEGGEADTTLVHWPVVLLYPETGQSDYIEDVSEVTTLAEILELVLPDDGPTPPWDTHGYYRASLCDVLYGSEMTKPVPIDEAWSWVEPAAGGDHEGAAAAGTASGTPAAGPRHWVRVPPAAPLLSPLIASDYIVPDIPVLHVVPRPSTYYAELKRRGGGPFAELAVPELPPPPA